MKPFMLMAIFFVFGALILELLLPIHSVTAQSPTVMGALQPVSHATLAPTTSTGIGLGSTVTDPTNVGQASRCFVGPVETNSIRYWLDGTVPTSTVGHLIPTAGSFTLSGRGEVLQFRMIGASGTASVPVSCSR